MTYNIGKKYRMLEESSNVGGFFINANPNMIILKILGVPDSQLWYFDRKRNIWILNDYFKDDLNIPPLDVHVFGLLVGIVECPNDEKWKPTIKTPYIIGNYKLGISTQEMGCPLAAAAYPEGYTQVCSTFPSEHVTAGVRLILNQEKNQEVPYEKRLPILETNVKIASLLPKELSEDFQSKNFYIDNLVTQINKEKKLIKKRR